MKTNLFVLILMLVIVGCQAKGGGSNSVVNNHAPSSNVFVLTTTLNKNYRSGQTVNFVMSFPAVVTVGGVPQLSLTVGASARSANYVSGSGTKNLLFQYTVAPGENDSDGISVAGTINLNGGSLVYGGNNVACPTSFTPPALTSVKVDSQNPSISVMTAPPSSTYIVNQTLIFTATFQEAVIVTGTPRIQTMIGSSTVYANYLSGSGTSNLIFSYAVHNSDEDTNGIGMTSPIDLNNGTIKDEAGNSANLTYTAPDTSSVLVYAKFPFAMSLNPPIPGTYGANQTLDFTVGFSKPVIVTGSPRLTLTIGSSVKNATYVSGSGSTLLNFRYTVISGDLDPDGISLENSIDLNEGTIRDSSANNALVTFPVPQLNGVKVSTTFTSPIILSIGVPSAPPVSGYDVGQSVDFSVLWSEAVTETGGTSRLKLDVGGVTRYANYVSGSGTKTFNYRYTVQNNDEDLDGLAITSPLELNGSKITSAISVDASLLLTSPDSSTLKIDARAPSIIANTVPTNGTYSTGQTLDFDVSFSEVVTAIGNPRIAITVGASTSYASYLSGSGTSTLKFRYTVGASDNDPDGISIASVIDLNGGSIKDSNLHASNLILLNTATSGIVIDNAGPAITSIVSPTNKTYTVGEKLDFTILWSEDVVVTGTPQMALTIGSTQRAASYVSGSGTNALVFSYTIQNADSDTDGVTVISPLSLNSGSLKDDNSNVASLSFTPPDTSGVLVSGSTPTILNLTLPPNGKYVTGQNIDIEVVFSENVVVSGTPRIEVTLDNGTVYADYLSGTNSSTLKFRYTVEAGKYDVTGMTLVSPLGLNGGSIKNVPLNFNASLTYTLPNSSGVKVDGLSPVITSVTPPADKTYILNDNMDFVVQYDSVVTVTGVPRLSFTQGSSTVYASYLSGSGTNNVTFRYTVAANDLDSDGITLVSPISLNGGTIQDPFGDTAGLTFTEPSAVGVLVDAIVPVISSVAGPTQGYYYLGNNLDFEVIFSEPVNVTGVPQISLNLGSNIRNATYLSGSGTSILKFRYTVSSGDLDTDGIEAVSPLMLNSGTIKDFPGNNLTSLNFTAPNTALVYVDGSAPYITSLTAPSNATYKTGEHLNFTATFSKPINVTGVPRLALNLGSSTVYANYLSGSGTVNLVFRYTVSASDEDADGIGVGSQIDLNSGSIKDPANISATLTFTAPVTTGVLVDGIDLVISSVSLPADGIYGSEDQLDFTVNFNANALVSGTPRISLTIGANTRYATFVSGSGTAAHLYRYTVATGELAANGISVLSNIALNGGSIHDAFGDSAVVTFTGGTYPDKRVDGIASQILSISAPAAGTYNLGNHLEFDVEFDENVTITGSPALSLSIGTGSRLATYLSGSGTKTIKFRYTLVSGDNDGNGIGLASPLNLNSGSIKDEAGNNAVLTFTAPDTSGVLINTDSINITGVSVVAGKYNTGSSLDIDVSFERSVVVTGTPQVKLIVGAQTLYANYLSGSGTSTLRFRKTIIAGESDTNGIGLESPLLLNSGAIKDVNAVDANLVFTAPNTQDVLVDGIDLVIASLTPPASKTYGTGENLDFDVTYNSPALVTGSPRIALLVGATTKYATYLSGTGTSSLKFRYTVASGEEDTNGITTISPIELNSGTIKDAFGDAAVLAFTGGNLSGVNIDGVTPLITSVTGPANGTYYANQNLDFVVNVTENITVSGLPRIQLGIGAATKFAQYFSGSGTNALTFRYTIASGETDLDGITVASPINLNSGTLADGAGNALSPLSFSIPVMESVFVNANDASIASVSSPADSVYKTSSNLDFTVTFTRPVTVTGIPRIQLTVGQSTVYANYISGSGSSILSFRYTVQAGDSDADGIVITSPVALNGGTIEDSSNGNATLTFTPPTSSGVKVDGIDIVLASVMPPTDGTYIKGQNLDFVAHFNSAPVITGTPRISLTLGTSSRYASYVNASGNSATFRYTVVDGDFAATGIVVSSNIDMNGGTIKDGFGDNAVVTFAGETFANKKVDAVVPTISTVTAPANGTYDSGQLLNFSITFSENVTISGLPRIALQIGSSTKYATYSSGSGTNIAVFSYLITGSDNDTDGIAVSSPLDLNGGSITDVPGNALTNLTFTAPVTSGILIAGNTASPDNSTISGTGPVVANGVATSTITVTLKNSLNTAVVGVVPTFQATDTGATNVYGTCSATNASGVSTCTLSSTSAETKTLTITSPVTKSDGTVIFTAGSAVADNSSISGTGPVIANGIATSTVTITLKDASNNVLTGVTPTFSATDTGASNVYGLCSSTNASGISTCTLKSTKAETKTLQLLTPVVKSGGQVVFQAGPAEAATSTITGTTPVSADGVSTSFIEVSLKDAFSNPIAGVVPIFNATDTNTTNTYGSCSATNGSGVSACTLSSTYAESKVLQLTSPVALTGSTVLFSGTLPVALNSTISGTGPVVANNSSTSTITITLRDANNNLVDLANGALPDFAATDTGTTNTYSTCSNQSKGIYTCALASKKAEFKTLSITSPFNKSGSTVTFMAGAIAATHTTITGTSPVVANGTAASTITITLRDQFENVVSGTLPTFSATDTNATNTQTACSTSDANGVSTCSLSSTKAETKALQLLTPVSKSGGTVAFIGGNPVAAYSSITGTGPVAADGTSTSLITITLKDTYQNPSSGFTPTFTATNTGTTNTYGVCSLSNASGISTCTLSSQTAETKTLSIASPFVKAGEAVVFQSSSVAAANSTITGTTSIVANGTSTSTITITLRNISNSPVAGITPTFTASGTNNTIGTCSASNSSGISTCTLASTKAELKNLSISSPVIKTGDSVDFIAGPATIANSSISASDPNLADGIDTCEVTITLRDAFDNAVQGIVPTYAMTGSLNTIAACPATDSAGEAICLMTSRRAQAKTVSLLSPVAKAGNTVEFNPVGINIQVPIELVDRGLSSGTAAITFARTRTSLNTSDYVSESNEYFFEIVAENTNTTTQQTVSLINSSGTSVSDLTVPASTISMRRIRGTFTPTAGADNYRVRLSGTLSGAQLKVHSAKIIVNQTKATATKIYVPLIGINTESSTDGEGGSVTSTDITSYTTLTSGAASIWRKVTANYETISPASDAFTLETITHTDSSSGRTTVGLFNKTTNTLVPGVETSTTGTTVQMAQVSFANNATGFTDDHDFEVRFKTASNNDDGSILKAGLWIKLHYLQKAEILYRLATRNSVSVSGTTDFQDARFLFELSEWSNPTTYFEIQGSQTNGTSSVELIEYDDTVSGTAGTNTASLSLATTYSRTRSSSFSMSNLQAFGVRRTTTLTSGSSLLGSAYLVIDAHD
jgi:Bacterial Ig-like domain (group 1)/Invasin, domain 3